MSTTDLATKLHCITDLLNRNLSTKGLMGLKPILRTMYSLMHSWFSVSPENSKLKFEETAALHNVLFEELRERLSFNLHRTFKTQDVTQLRVHGDFSESEQELLFLLRCYVLIVRLDPDNRIRMHKFPHVFFHELLPFQSTRIGGVSIRFTKEASLQSMCNGCSTLVSNDLQACSCDSCIHILKRIIEVILDELYTDRHFRQRITRQTFSSIEEDQCTFPSLHLVSMLDVITAHFILSVSGENILETFTQSLIWTKDQTTPTLELGLTVAISLVKYPIMLPILLRTHLFSLVSDVISIRDSDDVSQDERYMKYLSVFNDSMIIYSEYVSKLLADPCDSPYKIRRFGGRAFEPQFESEIYNKLNLILSRDSSWIANIGNMDAKLMSNLETDAISYLKMNMSIVAESSRDDVFSFMSSLITSIISSKPDEIFCGKIKKINIQDFLLLASTFKLMSCSLLRVTSRGRHSLVDMMSFLTEYKLHQPSQVRQLIDDALKLNVESKLILMHFASLLLLCKVSGLNFLVKGCLFTIMVFINMAISVGSLEFRRPSSDLASSVDLPTPSSDLASSVDLPRPSSELASSVDLPRPYSDLASTGDLPSTSRNLSGLKEPGVRKIPSLKLAVVFQRLRTAFLRDPEEVEKQSGEVYLKHFTTDLKTISELADFIVCKPEKNYTTWLNNKAELREKRRRNLAKRRWKRKRKTFRKW